MEIFQQIKNQNEYPTPKAGSFQDVSNSHVFLRAYHWIKLIQNIKKKEAINITTAIAVAADVLN